MAIAKDVLIIHLKYDKMIHNKTSKLGNSRIANTNDDVKI